LEPIVSATPRHRREIIVPVTHRGLRYKDGALTDVLEAGRYRLPRSLPFVRGPVVEISLVDMRERELTIKGQEILTSDKVAVRVSILTQFRVTDPVAALQKVVAYEDRLYSDVQLAARRSLASMTLESILTNRNDLSEDILRDVKDAAGGYGVEILRSDVKDLVFPGNLQEIMNRVLAAERLSEAQLVEARTQAEREQIEAKSQAESARVAAATQHEAARAAAEARAEATRMQASAEADAARQRAAVAGLFSKHPELLRLKELETLQALGANAAARLYVDFDRPARRDDGDRAD
jgi:regulator of protease activity HflC (stomatin/prohibitin superfamily)